MGEKHNNQLVRNKNKGKEETRNSNQFAWRLPAAHLVQAAAAIIRLNA